MTEKSTCRILIVDNELDYAAQTAAKLIEIRPSLLNHQHLQIELTNNAYFAAEKLRRCPPIEPPWDIVISDVYMPFPRDASDNRTLATAVLTEYEHEGITWPCWGFQYHSTQVEEIAHGGVCIAEIVAARLKGGDDMADLKMILMSNCLTGEDRELILDYQRNLNKWLRYYDKADWRRHRFTEWPANQSMPDVFQWALFQAITERRTKDWGHQLVDDSIPDIQAYIGETATDELRKIIGEARRLAGANDIEVVLITGEVGTGREVFAKMIHQLRRQKLGIRGEFVGIDCSSISYETFERELFDYVEDAADGTLFIDEVDKLRPPHQGKVYHLLKDRRIRGVDRVQTVDLTATLAICTASEKDLEGLNLSGLFHDDLYFLLRDEQLNISPLRERPSDAVSIAKVLARHIGNGFTLSEDAMQWIESYPWPGNNTELRSVIRTAARRELTSVLTAEDLQRVLPSGRKTDQYRPPIKIDEEVLGFADSLQSDFKDQRYVFRKKGEMWCIRYEGEEFNLTDSKGLQYIACLLQYPNREFPVLELMAFVDPRPISEKFTKAKMEVEELGLTPGLEDILKIDPQAITEYKAAIRELERDIDIAEQTNNTARKEVLEQEKLAIQKELAANIGFFSGKRDSSDPMEKARRAVANTYTAALKKIRKNDKNLELHLRHTINTGSVYVYKPDRVPPWKL